MTQNKIHCSCILLLKIWLTAVTFHISQNMIRPSHIPRRIFKIFLGQLMRKSSLQGWSTYTPCWQNMSKNDLLYYQIHMTANMAHQSYDWKWMTQPWPMSVISHSSTVIFGWVTFLDFVTYCSHFLQSFFIVLTPSWSNVIIFQLISDIVVFFIPMWSLTCLIWICTVTIQKKLIQLIKMLAFCSI